MRIKSGVALLIALSLVLAPAASAVDPKAVGRLSAEGAAKVNGVSMPTGTTVYAGDQIAAGEKSAVTITMPGGNRIVVAEKGIAQVREVGDQLGVVIERGAVGFVHTQGQPLLVEARGVLVRPAGQGPTSYAAQVESGAVVLTAVKGSVRVEGRNASYTVPAGKSMRFEVDQSSQGPAGAGSATYFSHNALILGAVLVGVGLAIALPLVLIDNKVSP